MNVLRVVMASALSLALATPCFAQNTQQTIETKHQLKQDQKVHKQQAKADKAERKALNTHEQKRADKAQDKANAAAAAAARNQPQ